jgi:predicted membrane protein
MRQECPRQGNRNLIGIIFILVGGLYLLQTLNILQMNIGHVVFSAGFFIFVVGVLILASSHRPWFGTFLALIGALMLLPRIYPWIDINDNVIFAVIIIGLGLAIIMKRRTYSRHTWHRDFKDMNMFKRETISTDFLDVVSVFSGGHHTLTSENFKGGNITAIFGGSEIDLSACKLADGENVLDILTIFGGTTLYVPRDWNIVVNVTPLFGGFSNKSRRDPSAPVDLSRTLVIKGLAIFGGGEIKS